MSWTRTRRYYRALLDIEGELSRARDGVLPWRDEYSDIFGTPDGLRLALRHHWELLLQAQVDGTSDDEQALRRLTREHSGLLLALYWAELPPAQLPTAQLPTAQLPTVGRALAAASGAA